MDNEGDGIADDLDDGGSVHPIDFPQPPTVQAVQRRFKKVETLVGRRQKKLTRQQQEVEQQREAIEGTQTAHTTLQYDVDTTRDELHSLKQEMSELGQQLADITAAHAECEEQDNASDAASEDLNDATHMLAQVPMPSATEAVSRNLNCNSWRTTSYGRYSHTQVSCGTAHPHSFGGRVRPQHSRKAPPPHSVP